MIMMIKVKLRDGLTLSQKVPTIVDPGVDSTRYPLSDLTRLGVPSIAGRLLKVIETCVYDLSLQTHTPLHYILGLSSQPLTPAKR